VSGSENLFDALREMVAVANPGLVGKRDLEHLEEQLEEIEALVDELEARIAEREPSAPST
jgi:hypothetical protein